MKFLKKRIIDNIIFMIIILGVISFLFPKLISNLNFGLDLKGGFEVLYQVNDLKGNKPTKEMLTSTYVTMTKRIDVLGVSEPIIVIEGEDKIRVQLAGITNQDEARTILSQAASLTFRDTEDNLIMNSSVLKDGGAKVSSDQQGRPAVSLGVKDKDSFFKATKAVSQKSDNRIVMWLDFKEGEDTFLKEQVNCGSLNSSKCLSVAGVSEGFSSDVIIQGDFTEKEVKNLVELINSGSLPTSLEEISSKNVAPSFGIDSLNKTFIAGLVGIIGILVIMISIYKFAGIISSFGIVFYTFLTIFAFWVLGGVLTLSGIAALVIGIAMAIDASVITFARIKEELEKGHSLKEAFKEGNKGAFASIFDANLTTLLTAIIMFGYGQSSVKGYATMLIISVIITMIIMVSLIRILLSKFVASGYFDDKLYLFIGYKKQTKKAKIFNTDYVGMRKKHYILITIIVLIGISSLAFKGFNLSVDFKGGTSINLKSDNNIDTKKLESDLLELKYNIINLDKTNDKNISLTLKEVLDKEQVKKLEEKITDDYKASADIGVVSNIVKKELIKNAFLSVLLSTLAIVIYITIRFKFSYAVGAVVSLLHDAFIVIAVFSIFNIEVSSIFVAAILSIIGYSLNDTIVTFDRIKENLKNAKKDKDLKDVINLSLNQTLVRSLITSLTTIIPIIALLVFGSNEIVNFNIALLIGLFAGVYSSLFIAAQLWYDIERKKIKKPKLKIKNNGPEEITIKGINA